MRFWDSSAVVPLFLEQDATAHVDALLASDPAVAYWWSTPVECWSAFGRSRREGVITPGEELTARKRLDHARATWLELLPSDPLRSRAGELLRFHPLRAADALQLAAGLSWAGEPAAADFVTLDERLASVAHAQGFKVLPERF
ncbi:MAG: type II toxin-antitoxin system VapC family toxin [Longimicrobiales bacterium]